MQNMKTVEEMANLWNVSLRHIQNMCKNGRIDGAVKRGGIWFIPAHAINPIKKKQARHKFEFWGTKKEIFEKAAELFMKHGFENVSMRDIAGAVGVKQAALYNHFASKQEILDTMYDFFRHYHFADRPTMEEIEPVLQSGSILDIIHCVRYDYGKAYEDYMGKVITILFQRFSIDDRARELTQSLLMEEGILFTKAVFDRGVEIGRLAALDTRRMAVMIQSTRVFTMLCWLLDSSPDNLSKVSADEQALYGYAGQHVTDLKPPAVEREGMREEPM